MMHGRKVFALCTAHIQNDEILECVQAFVKVAGSRGYGVLIYNADFDASVALSNSIASYSAYKLIPYSKVDAVVIMTETIRNHFVVDSICENAENANIPVISYDGILTGHPSVYSYPYEGFSDVMNHVMDIHGCKKVDLLTGIRGNYGSECMVVAYQEVLRNHGLEFDSNRVDYGDYWELPAAAAVERLLAYDIPDAFFCANDSMAMACCAVLRERGLRVPEDVIVTGLDGIVMERYHTPRLTTVSKDLHNMADAAIDTLEMMLEGEAVDHECSIPPIVCYSESCGCRVTEQRDQNEAISLLHRRCEIHVAQEQDEHRTLHILMQRKQPNVIDYLDVLASNMPEHACLCLRDSIAPDTEPEQFERYVNAAELMSTVSIQRKEKRYAMVSRAQIIPTLEAVLEAGQVPIISSVYFRNEIYGYYVYYGSTENDEIFKLPKFLHSAGYIIGAGLFSSRLQTMNDKLVAAKTRDSLTGMLNLNGALRALNARIQACEDPEAKVSMVVVGLRNLRQINSIFGHLEGDQALLSLSNAINDCIDSDVTAARIGGDEYMVAFLQSASIYSADAAEAFLTVLQNRLSSYNQVSGKSYSIEIAVGRVSAQINAALSLQGMLNEAIEMKDTSRDGMLGEEGHASRVSLLDPVAVQVEQVLNKNQMTYHFQPIVNAMNGQIYAYEALMRTTGDAEISPLTVIQYAAMMGRLYEVEWLTYCNVLAYMRAHEKMFEDRKIFINSIPGHFISDADFAKLRDLYSDLLPKLVVEFTEQAESDGEELKQMQNRLNNYGMEIAVDDYGTGYSNISNLLRYSPNYVKIDRSLISNIHEEPKKQHFVTNIIEFAHANGFRALAEGVETVEEMRAVIRFGVDLIQGNFTALPSAEPTEGINTGTAAVIVKISNEASKQFTRKTFMPNNRQSVRLDQLEQENYTDVFIAHPNVELVGDFSTVTTITVKIKDGIETHLVLRDVHLCAAQSSPCIILGKHSKVTLEFRGDNRMDHGGIFVPETSELHLTGRGNLAISTSDSEARSCAIGSDADTCFGDINIDLGGCLQLIVNGDQGVGIGGGVVRGQKITVCGTKLFIQMSCAEGIGIGACNGNCEIEMSGSTLYMETRVANCSIIGVHNGRPSVLLNTANIEAAGSGRNLVVVGSQHGGADIIVKDSTLKAGVTAQSIMIIGSADGAPKISMRNTNLDLTCEGMQFMDVGSVSGDADLTLIDSDFTMDIRSAKILHIMADPTKCIRTGITEHMKVNE